MKQEKIELLKEELADLQLAAAHLGYSLERCHNLIGQEEISPEQLERLESLTSRFARLADLLIQRIFRLIDDVELEGSGTILDRVYRAENRHLILPIISKHAKTGSGIVRLGIH